MQVSRIPCLLFINILFLFSSCALRNYHLTEMESAAAGQEIKNILPDTFSTVLYKAQVDLYRKYFGGLLFLKDMKDGTHRLVMTTETGLQLFDFELTNDSMKVHQCIEKLNRKAVIKTIETDFRLILMKMPADQSPAMLTDEGNMHNVYRYKQGKKRTYYFIENKTGYLDRIELASGWYRKVTVTVQRDGSGSTSAIRFEHHNAKLDIRLRQLKVSGN
jgi:hypothetical protein